MRAIQGTPWEPIPGRGTDVIPVRVHIAEEGGLPPNPANISTQPQKDIKRRARISREDVIRVGFTHGCPGCIAISRNAPSQNHTEECRSRIENALINEGGVKAKRIKIGLDRFDEHRKNKRAHGAADPKDFDPVGEKHPTKIKRSDVPGNKRQKQRP